MSISSDYKVLVVVDIQNCFIHGGSLGSMDIKDLKKYIDLVKGVELQISKNNYDLVVFTKDSHPLNHSSLTDESNAQVGVFKYHCRNSKHNCIKNEGSTTYMSSAAKETIRKFLCETNKNNTEHFYDKKKDYKNEEYNFYNPSFKDYFKNLLNENLAIKEQVRKEMNDLNYNRNKDQSITLNNLLKDYIENVNLDFDSKQYLQKLLTDLEKDPMYKNIKIKGLDINYLFYGTELKDIILNLNNKKKYEIGIKDAQYIANIPNYDENMYNVKKVEYILNQNTKFISLEKGQYCDYESYSAFNYHIEMEKDNKDSIIYELFEKYDSSCNVLNNLPVKQNYSTGLFEYILDSFKKDGKSKRNINIDVCGLAFNICVINTVHQGIAMWENLYKKYVNYDTTCKFNLLEYLSIPISIDIPDYPYLNYNYTQQITKEKDLGKKLLQVSNIKTLFTKKFEVDVIIPNPSIKNEISFTVDFNIDLNKTLREYINQINKDIIKSTLNLTKLNFTHNTGQKSSTSKKSSTFKKLSKGGKTIKINKTKQLFGKERCIYKKPGDLKEYLKHKGDLITVSEYKKLMKSEANTK
jgi:nicotinamidase-related amidase